MAEDAKGTRPTKHLVPVLTVELCQNLGIDESPWFTVVSLRGAESTFTRAWGRKGGLISAGVLDDLSHSIAQMVVTAVMLSGGSQGELPIE